MDKKTIEQRARILVEKMTVEPEVAEILKKLKEYDIVSFEHSINVAFIATQMGMERGMSEKRLKQLTIGALLHDIGKLGIDKNILDKKGNLTDGEYAYVKKHPKLGYDMVKDKSFSPTVLDIILHHHERMDGKGYPDGLTEMQIPIETQIVTVVDVWDAMTAERPYKKEFTGNTAYEELQSESNRHYNEAMIRLLMRVQDK